MWNWGRNTRQSWTREANGTQHNIATCRPAARRTNRPQKHILIIRESITTTKANNFALQVLAVDLLNPSAATEAKKHKLKVRPSKQQSFPANDNDFNIARSSRPSSPLPDLSSWTSSAPAASSSPPFSRTPRPSLSARDAPPFFANPPVARPDSLRAAHSEESKLLRGMFLFLG
jgi:hypothetical protein